MSKATAEDANLILKLYKLRTESTMRKARAFVQLDGSATGGNGSQGFAAARPFNMSGTQTVVAGIFLSLAFAFGGLWLVRSRPGVYPKLEEPRDAQPPVFGQDTGDQDPQHVLARRVDG